MTFPPLLLGLHVAAFVVALLVSSWLAHTRPLGADGRRIADATERAGVGQNRVALRVALGAILGTSLVAAGLSVYVGGPALWFGLVPLVVATAVLATGVGVARLVTRTAARLLGESGRDQNAVLLGRSALVATLIPEAVSALLVLGTFSWGERSLGPKVGLQLAFVAAATVSILSCVFARACAAFSSCIGGSAPTEGALPHPGSLAELVASAFQRPLLSTAALMTTSSLGHALLLAYSVGLSGEASSSSLLYPHLLRAMGLLALVFGKLVVRSSEREPTAWAWTRGVAVTFALLIAGAWSLAPSLEDAAWARLLPGGASFVFVAAFLGAALLGLRRSSTDSGVLAPTRLLGGVLLCLLGLASYGLLRLTAGPTPLPAQLGHGLFAACLLSLLPLLHSWRIAQETARAANLATALGSPALAEGVKRNSDMAPPTAWTASYWLLIGLVALEAASLPEAQHSEIMLLGLGALLGAISLIFALASSARACRKARADIAAHFEGHARASGAASSAGFAEVLELAQRSRAAGFVAPLLLVAGGALLWSGLARLAPDAPVATTGLGFVLGCIVCGAVVGWLLEDREPAALRGHAALALPLGLSLVTWLTAGLQFL